VASDGGVGKWTGRLQDIADVSEGSWTNVVPKSALLPVIALLTSLADLIGAAIGVPINVLDATAEAAGGLVDAIFGGSALIIDTGAIVSADSLGSGVWAQFGPFTFIVGLGVVGIAAYVFAEWRSQEETSDWLFFLPDIPFFGAEEEDEA